MLDRRGREAKLDRARVAVRDLVARDDVDSVYLTGSLTAGLGTSRSDVDVFVIGPDRERERPPQLMEDGQRIDLELRSIDYLRDLGVLFSGLEASREDQEQLFRADRQFDDAARLLYAQPVKNGPTFAAAHGTLRANRDRLRRSILAFRQLRCINAVEDVAGFLDDGDVDSAVAQSQLMLVEAAELFAVGCGDLYLGQKWVWQRLARSAGEGFPLERLKAAALGTAAEDAATVLARLRLVQALMLAALVAGWDSPDAGSWSHWGTGSAQVHRSHLWLPMRFVDGCYLIDVCERQMSLQPDALRLWGACDGSASVAEVAQRWAAGVTTDPEAAAREATDTECYLDRLAGRGLLVLP